MYTKDMYDAAPGILNSPADPGIAAAGWNVVGYLTAQGTCREIPEFSFYSGCFSV
jgi:hypothetical protein